MKKCPFCSEEIQSEAIKCRYCGERLNTKPVISCSAERLKSQEKLCGQDNSLHEASKTETTMESFVENEEIIIEVYRQFNLYMSFPNLSLKTNDIWDLIFTNKRLVFVKADKRFKLNPAGGIIMYAIVTAFEKYQEWKKDRKIDLDSLNTLIENELAIVAYAKDIKCIINEIKMSVMDHLAFYQECRVAFEGDFLLKNKKEKGFIAFQTISSIKEAKKSMTEKPFHVEIIISDTKIDKQWRLKELEQRL